MTSLFTYLVKVIIYILKKNPIPLQEFRELLSVDKWYISTMERGIVKEEDLLGDCILVLPEDTDEGTVDSISRFLSGIDDDKNRQIVIGDQFSILRFK